MRKGVGLGVAVLGAAVVVLWFHQVPDRTTPNDARAIQRLMPAVHGKPQSFEQEVALILNVQDRVLAVSPEERGIPLNQPREIADLLRVKHGACFDRSRAIEMALRSYGFQTRHASMYSTVATGSPLRSLLTPDNISHALTEVKTSRGWMIVDSKTRWMALTSNDRPLDLASVREDPRRKWSSKVKSPLPEIYGQPFTWVYGLYSRHGRFYPPFDPIPDVNWAELAQNV